MLCAAFGQHDGTVVSKKVAGSIPALGVCMFFLCLCRSWLGSSHMVNVNVQKHACEASWEL